ncbi:MAG: hypothetical protein U0Q16_38835 [Bryobacteraceae bacterium]
MTGQKRVADAIFQAAQQGCFDDALAAAAELDHPLGRGDVFEPMLEWPERLGAQEQAAQLRPGRSAPEGDLP